MSRNSITPLRAFCAFSDLVWITMLSVAGIAQEAIGFGAFSCSTRHMRQLPAIAKRSWKQKCGTSTPRRWHACSTVVPGGTAISCPSIVSLGIVCSSNRSGRARSHRGVAVVLDTLFHLGAEMADQPLDRPGRGVAERADRVAVDLER